MNPVNQQSQLNQLGRALVESLQKIDAYESDVLARRERDTVHVQTVGSTISTAYEQLRNASEYAEDELLQQRAIRRYLKRVLSFHEKVSTAPFAEELVTELTQSEYLVNDFTTKKDIKDISDNIKRYYDAYWRYAESEHNITKRIQFEGWMLDVLAVRCEQILKPHIRQLLFAHFAIVYLQDKIKMKKMVQAGETIDEQDYPIILYVAIHRALLKSDSLTIRAALLDSYHQNIDETGQYEAFNQKLDYLFQTKTVAYTTRIVGKNGAALRFIYSGFYADKAPLTIDSLRSQDNLDSNLRRHIDNEYTELNKRLDKGILRSITFLLITKSIIGLGVEVPYDLFVGGHIVWMPLIINLLFPAVFIAISRLALTTPNDRNTAASVKQITTILFDKDSDSYKIRIPKESSSIGFNTAYVVMFLAMFAGLSYILYLLEFNIVQGIIFFIFLSTASFLSFRLSRQINELEVVHTSQGSLSLLRDVLYMPFIKVGQQISYRYSKVNIVATVLDILIELPLKTILRLVRQWTSFLNSKKDELI
jgi:hypothetical protein